MMQKILLSVVFSLFFNLNLSAITGTSYTTKRDRVTGLYQDAQPYVGVFADLMTAQRESTVSIQFQYNIPVDLVSTDLANGGTIVHDTNSKSMAKISTGTDANGLATISSRSPVRYIPGHEAYVYFTAGFTKGVENSTQWAGVFDDNNGFAVGYSGVDFSILYRRGVSGAVAEEIINQSDFNIDSLNGKGPSGIFIDPTKINIFRISFGWLGTAPIILQISRQDGTWFTFHKIQRANNFTVPSIYNPVLPIRMEARNDGNTSDVIMHTASWCGGVLGGNGLPQRQYSISSKGFTFSSTSEKVVIALRNQTTFETKINKNKIHLVRAYFSATSATTFFDTTPRLVRFTFYKGNEGMVSGGTWLDQDPAVSNKTSSIEYNISATGYSGSEERFFVPFVSRESREIIFGVEVDYGLVIELNPGEELAIVASSSDTTTVTGDMSIVWNETIS